MINTLSIIKVEENTYRLSGRIGLLDTIEKSVLVDGEYYYNSRCEEKIFDIDEIWSNSKDEFYEYETDFMNKFGLPEIKMNTWQSKHSLVYDCYNRSENNYVNYLQLLNGVNVFPYELHFGKRDGKYYDFENWHKGEKIEVILDGYGFNNSIYCYLNYAEILEFNITPETSYSLKPILFPKKTNQLTDEEKLSLLQNYIEGIKENTEL